EAEDRGADGIYETARGRNRDEPREETVAAHRGVGLPEPDPHVEDGSEGARAAREHGVDRDRADTEVAVARGPEGAPRVEAEPPEGEDEAAEEHHGDVVPGDRVGRAIAVVLPDARPDDHRDGECREAADRVHHP